MHDFSNKTVVVTGASRGIGYAIAEGFARCGADVILLAETEQVMDATARLKSQSSGDIKGVICDISDSNAVANAFSNISSIDVLVNNAGLELITPVIDSSPETEATFRRITDININGTYYVTSQAVNRMTAGAKIINTASIWGKTAVAGFSAYCASKHANIGFTKSIAQELGHRGINVNAVCPGFIKTEASSRSVKAEAERSDRSITEVLNELLRNQALSGLLTPTEVVPLYLFLASEDANNITGQSINLDRGDTML